MITEIARIYSVVLVVISVVVTGVLSKKEAIFSVVQIMSAIASVELMIWGLNILVLHLAIMVDINADIVLLLLPRNVSQAQLQSSLKMENQSECLNYK